MRLRNNSLWVGLSGFVVLAVILAGEGFLLERSINGQFTGRTSQERPTEKMISVLLQRIYDRGHR
jgi:hypothetical protein